jgi:hypothetical protein
MALEDGSSGPILRTEKEVQFESTTKNSPGQLNVILNWFTELQQGIPVK